MIQTKAEDAEFVSVGEAARLLGVSVDTVRRWDRAGHLMSMRTPGGHRRISRADVERLRTERPEAPA